MSTMSDRSSFTSRLGTCRALDIHVKTNVRCTSRIDTKTQTGQRREGDFSQRRKWQDFSGCKENFFRSILSPRASEPIIPAVVAQVGYHYVNCVNTEPIKQTPLLVPKHRFDSADKGKRGYSLGERCCWPGAQNPSFPPALGVWKVESLLFLSPAIDIRKPGWEIVHGAVVFEQSQQPLDFTIKRSAYLPLLISTTLTSKTRVAPPGMSGGAPREP